MSVVDVVPAPNWLGVVFGVPVPTIVNPTPEMAIPEVQVQTPAGILIVSPFWAT
jgi:hypothetical protein